MADDRTWTHGCDACGADVPVVYVAPLGYLCTACRTSEGIARLRREMVETWRSEEHRG